MSSPVEKEVFGTMAGRIAGWVLTGAIAIIVLYAWFDGGEEDLRVIRKPLAISGGAA